MKKAVLVFLFLFLFLLPGCKKLSPDGGLKKNFEGMTGYTAKISVTAKEIQYSFDFTRKGEGNYTISLTSPDALSGIAIEKWGEKTTINYKGFAVPLDFLPSEMYNGIDKLTEVLMKIETLVTEFPVTAKTETIIKIDGKIGSSLHVFMEFDTETLLPLSVKTKINGEELTAAITEFKILK